MYSKMVNGILVVSGVEGIGPTGRQLSSPEEEMLGAAVGPVNPSEIGGREVRTPAHDRGVSVVLNGDCPLPYSHYLGLDSVLPVPTALVALVVHYRQVVVALSVVGQPEVGQLGEVRVRPGDDILPLDRDEAVAVVSLVLVDET